MPEPQIEGKLIRDEFCCRRGAKADTPLLQDNDYGVELKNRLMKVLRSLSMTDGKR
jgi:hypothetical protein